MIEQVLIQELSDHSVKLRYKSNGVWYPGYYHNRKFLPTTIGRTVLCSYGVWVMGTVQPCGCQKILFACATVELIPWKSD